MQCPKCKERNATVYSSTGFGRDIHGGVINTAVRMNDVRGLGKEWVSVDEAAEIARMTLTMGNSIKERIGRANRFIPQLKQIWKATLVEHNVSRIEVALSKMTTTVRLIWLLLQGTRSCG